MAIKVLETLLYIEKVIQERKFEETERYSNILTRKLSPEARAYYRSRNVVPDVILENEEVGEVAYDRREILKIPASVIGSMVDDTEVISGVGKVKGDTEVCELINSLLAYYPSMLGASRNLFLLAGTREISVKDMYDNFSGCPWTFSVYPEGYYKWVMKAPIKEVLSYMENKEMKVISDNYLQKLFFKLQENLNGRLVIEMVVLKDY